MRTKRPAFDFAPGSDWPHSDKLEAIEKGAEYASEYAYAPSKTPLEGFSTFKLKIEVVGKTPQNFRFRTEKAMYAFIDYLTSIHGSKASHFASKGITP